MRRIFSNKEPVSSLASHIVDGEAEMVPEEGDPLHGSSSKVLDTWTSHASAQPPASPLVEAMMLPITLPARSRAPEGRVPRER